MRIGDAAAAAYNPDSAGVAELVDATDLKSVKWSKESRKSLFFIKRLFFNDLHSRYTVLDSCPKSAYAYAYVDNT